MGCVWDRSIRRYRRLGVWLDQWVHQWPLVLCYHRIASENVDPFALAVSPDHFSQHLEVLRRSGRRVVPLSQIWNGGSLDNRMVAITFDDGYADNLYEAKPLLDKYEFPATLFIATGYIESDAEFWWDELDRILDCERLPPRIELENKNGRPFQMEADHEKSDATDSSPKHVWRAWEPAKSAAQRLYCGLYEYLRPLEVAERVGHMATLRQLLGWNTAARPQRRALTWAELGQLFASPSMQPGGHTVHHVDLSSTTLDIQRVEIAKNKKILEDRTAKRVREFAFPYGSYGTMPDATTELLRQAGFFLAFTTIAEGIRASLNPFRLPRYCIHDWNGDEFGYRLALQG